MSRQYRFIAYVLAIAFLAACAVSTPTSAPVPQATDGIPTREVGPIRGGTMVFPIYQDPGQLNPYLLATGETALIAKSIYEGLVDIGPDSQYYPRLASELPTKENGGVSDDGLTVTWKLRDNVTWSDGEPFTSSDVEFTWEAVAHADSVAYKRSQGWDLIRSIEAPDEHTVVVRYGEYFYNYLDQFSGYEAAILPRHACGAPGQMPEWDCNRQPVGTGPFVLEEWRPGESLTLGRNPNYREVGKPYLERIVFPVVPDETVRKAMLENGEGDAMLWLNFEHADEMKTAGVRVTAGSDMWVLRMGFNLSNGGELDSPHPILSDKRVRKAIQLAVDPNLINEGVLNGMGVVMPHELFRGSTACPKPELIYSKEAAKSLLEGAGWVDQDGDGTRECHGCLHAEDGYRMSMEIITSPDPPTYSRMIQVITDELSSVGIELRPSTPDTMWERYESGDFDIGFWDDGYTSDPLSLIGTYYSSASIPVNNFFRFTDSEFDRLFAKVRTIQDPVERLEVFCEIDRLLFDQVPVVWLSVMPYPDAFSGRMSGWQANPNDYMTWDIADWWISE